MHHNGNGGREVRWWAGVLAFLGALWSYLMVGVMLYAAGKAGWLGEHPDVAMLEPIPFSIQILIISLSLTGVAFLFPMFFGRRPVGWLELEKPTMKVTGLAVLGIVGLGFGVDAVIFEMHRMFPETFTTDGLDMFNRVFVNASPLSFVVLSVVISAGPGLGEEFLFRGMILKAFRGGLPTGVAVFVSAVLFGVIHGDLLQGTGAFLIGLFLGYVAVRAGTIWPCVIAHGVNNLLCALFARLDPMGAETVWETGHPPWLSISALIIVAISVWGIHSLPANKNEAKKEPVVS